MVCYGYGLGCSMYAYIPEILPPTGVGLVMFLKWGFIAISSKGIPILINELRIYWTVNIFICKESVIL